MSKPKELEWSLAYWNIEYGVARFDVGDIGPDPANWQATIVWTIKNQKEVPNISERHTAKTFKEVKEWIEKETGNKYGGFSYDHEEA